MKNREFVSPFNRPRDIGDARGNTTSKTIEQPKYFHIVPMMDKEYDGNTVAAQKKSFDQISDNTKGYGRSAGEFPVPPGGRGIKGYKETAYRSDTAVFRESGRVVKRDQAIGKVIVPTNHPNSDINKIYG